MVLLGSIPFFKKKEENIEGNPLILLLEVIFFVVFLTPKSKAKNKTKKINMRDYIKLKLLHRKGNHQQNEKVYYETREPISKPHI